MRRGWKWVATVIATAPITLIIIDQGCFRGSGFPPPHLRRSDLFGQGRKHIPGTIALIVNGAISPQKNHARYWNNTSLVFSTLKARGFERLAVLQSDGISPEPDQQARSFLGMFGTGTLRDSPRDLDGDGLDDVTGPGTVQALDRTLHDLGQSMQGGGPTAHLLDRSRPVAVERLVGKRSSDDVGERGTER